MLTISGIKKGIVIDHIKAGEGIKIFNFLNLDTEKHRVALLMNVESHKMGFKDIIKIENELNIDLDVLGLFSQDITINIIKNEKIIKKMHLNIPQKISGIVKCKNPRCITSVEKEINNSFILLDKNTKEYSCEYCSDILKVENLHN